MRSMTTLTRVRRDAVDPEYAAGYYQLGCEVNPVPLGCLSCPLPVCKYDMPNPEERKRSERAKLRLDRSLELLAQGLTVREVARQLGVSTRLVHRHKASR